MNLQNSVESAEVLANLAARFPFTQTGTGAIERTVAARLRDRICILDFIPVENHAAIRAGSSTFDCAAGIQAALNANLGPVHFPNGRYCIESPITIEHHGAAMVGSSRATIHNLTHIKYTGTATTSAMFRVKTARHGFSIDGFQLDANALADICLHIESDSGSSTQHPEVKNVYFAGYKTRGLILGQDSITENCTGQMQMVILEKLYWGGAGAAGAIGMLLNAQNAEWVVARSLYFDPYPDDYEDHLYHIYARVGGLSIQGLLSTRATSYAVKAHSSQILINGWRSEDAWLYQSGAVEMEGPTIISGVSAREVPPLEGTPPVATDPIIDFQGIDSALVLNGVKLNASIRFGSTDAKYITTTNVRFTDPAAGYIYAGSPNVRGLIHRVDTGTFDVRGTAPALALKNTAGTTLWEATSGSVRTPAVLPTAITTDPVAYDPGAGSFFRLTNDGAHSIHGVAGGTNGRQVLFVNLSAGVLTIKHLSGTASPTTGQVRCSGAADITLSQHEAVEMIYDANSQYWRAWKR